MGEDSKTMNDGKNDSVDAKAAEILAKVRARQAASDVEPAVVVGQETGRSKHPTMRQKNKKMADQFLRDFEKLNSGEPTEGDEEIEEEETSVYDGYTYGRTEYDKRARRELAESYMDLEELDIGEHLLTGYARQRVPLLFDSNNKPTHWAMLRTLLSSDYLLAADAAADIVEVRGRGSKALITQVVQQALVCCQLLGIGPSEDDIAPVPSNCKQATLTPVLKNSSEAKRVRALLDYFLSDAPPQLLAIVETHALWLNDRVSRMWGNSAGAEGVASHVKAG